MEKGILWTPGMQLRNSNGDVTPSATGYDYTIRTTTAIRQKAIKQKFYEVAPADFMPVIVGTGAWMQDIKTNLTYDVAGDFDGGVINTANLQDQLGNVDVALSSKNAKVITWAKGYKYSVPELELALASNNWDVVSSKSEALKRHWDLGVQRTAFLGMKSHLTTVPGLLTNADVTIDTTTIGTNISAMSAADFAALVANILAVYAANANYTVMPNKFVIPMDDYLGLATPVSPSFPNVSMLTYLEDAFKRITMRPDFKILPLAYANAPQNVGYVAVGGKYRYTLYNDADETLALDIPVMFNLLAPNTGDNFFWNGVGAGQFTGCIVYRPREVIYFDHD